MAPAEYGAWFDCRLPEGKSRLVSRDQFNPVEAEQIAGQLRGFDSTKCYHMVKVGKQEIYVYIGDRGHVMLPSNPSGNSVRTNKREELIELIAA